jgi:hypothetical protein
MGCIQASSYTSGNILGTYSGVDALDQCNNFCGVCCIPGCESDFANINTCTSTPSLIPCEWCEYYIDENTQTYYVDTNYSLSCENFTAGWNTANSGPWIAQTQYGYCPANYASGCFDGSYDCSSEFIKASGEYIDYFSDPTNIYSFISGGVYTNATTSDPCGGNYPCTKIIEVKTFSTISVKKNPYGTNCYNEPCEVVPFDSKSSLGIWDDTYLGGCYGLFTNECFVYCPNGTGVDPTMGAEITAPGAYGNYIPDCCSGVINPNNNTNKDKVWIFRIKGSVKKIIVYNEGNHLSNQTYNGVAPDYLCTTCNETPTEGPSGIYVSEIHYAISRAHDLRVYLCDPTTTTMTDVSNYICNKNIPFFVPTPFDSIDWVNDEGYSLTTLQNFAPIVGTIWGMSPIGQTNGASALTSYNCANVSPCGTDGYARFNLDPNEFCPGCDPFNGIVGTTRQSNGTLYIVHTATSVSGSLSPIGVATPPLVQFPDLPYISGNAVNYTCSDTIGQSGCSDQIGSTWYSGQNCTSFNCNI